MNRQKPKHKIGLAKYTRMRILRGVSDTIGVAVSAFLIVVVLTLMGSLFSWLRSDMTTTFSGVAESIYEAVFIGD